MKKSWLIFILILLALVSCYAEGMTVLSFDKDDYNFKAKVIPVHDANGSTCSVIKIAHNISGDIFIAEDKAYKRVVDGNQIVYFWISKWEKNITITAPGYLPYKYAFPVRLEEMMTYNLVLQGESESIDVYDIPVKINTNPQGATVYIDEVKISSKTPLREFFDSGIYPIKIELPNYSTFESYINIGAAGVDTTYTLVADFGTMIITSQPEVNMFVVLNGEEIGQTPITLEKKPTGRYVISAYNEFYRGAEQYFFLNKAETLSVELEPTSDYGTLTIKSDPEAEVFINDKKIDLNENLILSPQTVTVIAKKNKHRDALEKLILRKGEFKEVEIYPQLISGDILVNPTPDSVKVELLGDAGEYFSNIGLSKFSDIPCGEYTLVLTCNQFLPYQQKIILKEGNRERIDQELVRASYNLSLDFPSELLNEASILIYDLDNKEITYSTDDHRKLYLENPGLYNLVIQTDNRVIFSKELNIDINNSPKLDIRYMKFIIPSLDCKVKLNKKVLKTNQELITAYEVGDKLILKVEIPQATSYTFSKVFTEKDRIYSTKKIIKNIDYQEYTNSFGIALSPGRKKIFYGIKLPIIYSPYYQEFNGIEMNLFAGNYGPTSGIYEFEGGTFNGISISLIAGSIKGNMNGISIAPIANITDNTQKGIQFSLINYAKILKGAQIGLINITGKESKSLRFFPIINLGF